MARDSTATLLLSSGEGGAAHAALQQAAGASSSIRLSQFLSNPQHFPAPKEKILLAITTEQKEAVATAAAAFLSLLQADGLLVVAIEGAEVAETFCALGRSFLYAGFISVDNNHLPSELLHSVEQQPAVHLGAWKRPKWAVGTSAPIGELTGALVDEDALIDSAESYKPIGKGRSDCASRPRACANCTCGRKEAEEAADKDAFKKQLESGAIRSSCGNCYLGDAFRCAGCPYKGLPAFRPGQKVDLSGEVHNATAAAAVGVLADARAAGVTVAKGSNKVTLASLDDDS